MTGEASRHHQGGEWYLDIQAPSGGRMVPGHPDILRGEKGTWTSRHHQGGERYLDIQASPGGERYLDIQASSGGRILHGPDIFINIVIYILI